MNSKTYFMEVALRLARRGLGRVWPGPAEGCVIVAPVADGQVGAIVARGWTDRISRAVSRAITMLEEQGRSSEMSVDVFLTGDPSAEDVTQLEKLRPKTIYIACRNTDGEKATQRIEDLTKAGTQVAFGLCRRAAEDLNREFFWHQRKGRPHFTLKLATTLDGSIATHAGASQWITNEQSRALVQRLRYEADAIMVGSATAIADDPQLTCRLPGLSESAAIRIVADGRLRLPLTSKLVQTSQNLPTLLLTKADNDPARSRAFQECGVEILTVALDRDKQLDMDDAASKLADRGITSVLVEGGARLGASLLMAGLIDRLVWFHAPKIMGADGQGAIAELGLSDLSKIKKFRRSEFFEIGDDIVQFLETPKS